MTARTAWRIPLALLALSLLFQGACQPVAHPGTASRRPASPQGRSTSDAFVLTFWCGPPLDELDDRRAAEIAEAGFNVVGFPCEGAVDRERNLRALDTLERHGLRAFIRDPRFEGKVTEDARWPSLVDQAAADYRGSPALAGYWVEDEPDTSQFASISSVLRRLKSADPAHSSYVNLPADYTVRGSGALSYDEYVRSFIAVTRPEILSYDYYPFLVNGDRPGFFDNLALMRSIAKASGIPFLLVLQAMPHAMYRDPTFAELAWQAFHALAYGARGISYFAYWTPVNVVGADVMRFRRGLIEDGRPTRHYCEAARLNRTILAYAHELEGAQSAAAGEAPPVGCLTGLSGGPVTVGLFTRGVEQLILLVNRDYRNGTRVSPSWAHCVTQVEELDPESQRWLASSGSVELDPGGARLLRVADGGCCSGCR